MKNIKKIGVMIVIMACVIGYNLKSSGYKNMTSGLVLANVEALAADNEHSGGGYDCCDSCSGAYCGIFYPSHSMSGIGINMYYKI